MMKNIHLLLLAALIFYAPAAFAMGSPPPKEVTLTGTLRMVGNEPFTALILETADKKTYLISGAKKTELSTKQYNRVEITGTLEKSGSPYAQEAVEVKEYKILKETP